MSENVVISVDKELDKIKSRNLFLTVTVLNFIWMLFHFTVVFFFTLKLESVALVGVFLGIGNLFAFLLDIPVGIIQNYFKAKTLYIIACVSQLIAMLIFANFIFQVTDFVTTAVVDNSGALKGILSFFLSDGLNIILMLVASFCYGLTKELQDVTTISYILNNASPNQYAGIFAKNNVAMGLGSLFGLLLSGVILSFAPTLIIFVVILIIFLIIYFTSNFFDNGEKTLNLKDVSKFKVLFEKGKLIEVKDNLKENISKTVNSIELKDIIKSSNYVFLKPTTLKSGLTLSFLVEETKKTLITTYKVLSNKQSTLLIYWSITILLTFGFRDTFASTFLIDFLDGLWKGGSYILLGIIALPAFGLQDFFGKMANKYGNYSIANVGLILSGVSLFLMGAFSLSGNTLLIMGLALINSIGYASCMSLSQAVFLEEYNKNYASFNNLKEIDANASAAPMKILQNLANVFGLFFGGLILAILNYIGFFIVFGIFICRFLYWSLKKRKEIQGK